MGSRQQALYSLRGHLNCATQKCNRNILASSGPDMSDKAKNAFPSPPVGLVTGVSDQAVHLFHGELFFCCTMDIFAWKRSESYLTSIQGWVMEGRDVGNEALKYKSISCRDYQSYLTGM